MLDIRFDASKPIYRQLVEQMLAAIRQGELRPGDRLPTERQLAERLQIARGTVKRAYRELADNNIIEVIQGSGSYVYQESDRHGLEHRRLALAIMDDIIAKLSGWDLSQKEIATLFRMSLAGHSGPRRGVRIAVIDCNPETLSQFKSQLGYIPGVALSLIMVDSVLLDDNPGRLLEGFDLVLTTVTHYEQVRGSLRGADVRLLAVDMAPSRQTIVGLSALPDLSTVGIICQSNKFAWLVSEQVELFTGAGKSLPVHFEQDAKGSIRFMRRHRAVITAPGLLLLEPGLAGDAVEQYQAAGGRVIPFDYHIDRASLIQVEERVDQILRSREDE